MKLIAGVDIGNSTTEVCIGSLEENGAFRFLASASRMTTGTKGTLPNVQGVKAALLEALEKIDCTLEDLDEVRLNEAAPVIGDTAMETITETIITESSMIGHNHTCGGRTGGRRADPFGTSVSGRAGKAVSGDCTGNLFL